MMTSPEAWMEGPEMEWEWERFLGRIREEGEDLEGVVLTVTELNQRIKGLLEDDPSLQGIWVKGEVSNWRVSQQRHAYFTLKDETSQIECVIWRERLQALPLSLKDGDHICVYGNIRVFLRGGKYEIDVFRVRSEGKLGELYARLIELRRKLAEEGLFREERKRPLPPFPERIGIVTSPDGAAIWDIIRVTRQRFPGVQLILIPSLVQGEEAPASLVRAIKLANSEGVKRLVGKLDVLIIGRGGGSVEDLWAFNDEGVVRAVAASCIPTVSAVGHEGDYTLTDEAADKRAPTPSAAAQLVIPDRNELVGRSENLTVRLNQAFRNYTRRLKVHLDDLTRRPCFRQPLNLFADQRQSLDNLNFQLETFWGRCLTGWRQTLSDLEMRLTRLNPKARCVRQRKQLSSLIYRSAMAYRESLKRHRNALALAHHDLTQKAIQCLKHRHHALSVFETRLRDLSPYTVLNRGYALVRDPGTGKVITRAHSLSPGQEAELVMGDGEVRVTVKGVTKRDGATFR